MFDWFTTVPGILVLCGIVLLFIAVILFVLGNKKEKTVNVQAPVEPTTDNGVSGVAIGGESITSTDISTLANEPLITEPTIMPQSEVIDFTPEASIPDTNNEVSENGKEDFDFSIEEPVSSTAVEENFDFSIEEPVSSVAVEETPVSMIEEPVQAPAEETPVNTFGTFEPSNTEPEVTITPVEPVTEVNEAKIVEPVTPAVEEVMPTENISTIPIPDMQAQPDAIIEAPAVDAPVIEPVADVSLDVPTIEPISEPVSDIPVVDATVSPVEPTVTEEAPVIGPAEVQVEQINTIE